MAGDEWIGRPRPARRSGSRRRAEPLSVGGHPASAFAEPALEPPTRVQQQADALILLAETALHHELDPGGPGERYQVVVHVDAQALEDPDGPGQSVLEDGSHVPAGTSRRLACDASRVVNCTVSIEPSARTATPGTR